MKRNVIPQKERTEKCKQVKKLVQGGAKISAACKEVGIPVYVFNNFKSKKKKVETSYPNLGSVVRNLEKQKHRLKTNLWEHPEQTSDSIDIENLKKEVILLRENVFYLEELLALSKKMSTFDRRRLLDKL